MCVCFTTTIRSFIKRSKSHTRHRKNTVSCLLNVSFQVTHWTWGRLDVCVFTYELLLPFKPLEANMLDVPHLNTVASKPRTRIYCCLRPSMHKSMSKTHEWYIVLLNEFERCSSDEKCSSSYRMTLERRLVLSQNWYFIVQNCVYWSVSHAIGVVLSHTHTQSPTLIYCSAWSQGIDVN